MSRKERHGVSFAVPYRDVEIQAWEPSGSVQSQQDSQPCLEDQPVESESIPKTCTIGTSTYLEDTSCDHFSNMDEFGIIVGASSHSSLLSGTYSYDPVFSTDDDASTTKKSSPMQLPKNLEVDPWRVDNLGSFPLEQSSSNILVRKDTPPPKPVIPRNNEKDLREFIRRRHTSNLSMSTQTLRKSGGISSENLVSKWDSNEANLSSFDQNVPLLYNDDKEVRYENIATISASIRDKSKTTDDMVLNLIKKIKSPDESTYL
ncbi:uncharacterized protein LOC125179514 [Hyalella azteca]|uniref:Uncharacterized protein LOC125179514 n=1 Tax=Hyalella azteca TaxID=294128 RepID=A0A979FXN7_HYAAZ|nr:uncharacterized protein LOC125179514 [Hyalella azteca]